MLDSGSLIVESNAFVEKVTELVRETSHALEVSHDVNVIEQAKTLVAAAEGSMNRVLRTAFVACGGIAVVVATSWLFARVRQIVASRRLEADLRHVRRLRHHHRARAITTTTTAAMTAVSTS